MSGTDPKPQRLAVLQNSEPKIAVIGAGAWGTSLALLFARNGHKVTLWARRGNHANDMILEGQNREYLPGVMFPPNLIPTANALEAMEGAELAVVAVPSKGLHETLETMPHAPAYLSVTKGLRYTDHNLLRMTQEISSVTGISKVAALSGPNLAEEISRGLPATSVVASEFAVLASRVQKLLSGPTFRVYTSSDIVGVEIGGALKNVIALSAGMADGLGVGENAKAALLTRGIREIVKFGVAQGAVAETFYGLSGMGDLIATCASESSRNRSAGEAFASGATLDDLEAKKSVVEGVYTVKALHNWAKVAGIELPITEAVYRVIYKNSPAKEEIAVLMARGTKRE